jgi:hypothetical protein
VKLEWLHRRVREIVDDELGDDPGHEVERLLVGDAVVAREGDHYRIERGGETWEELERLARELGCARCGTLLDREGAVIVCPGCGDVRGRGWS